MSLITAGLEFDWQVVMSEASLKCVQLRSIIGFYFRLRFHCPSASAIEDIGSGGRRRSKPLLIIPPILTSYKLIAISLT